MELYIYDELNKMKMAKAIKHYILESKSKIRDILLKALQIVPIVFTAVTIVFCLVFIIKNNITIRNLDNLAVYFTGSTLAIATVMIAFNVVKSVAMIISPVFLYALSGMVFELRIILITSSIKSSAVLRPSKMWALSAAFFLSKLVLL